LLLLLLPGLLVAAAGSGLAVEAALQALQLPQSHLLLLLLPLLQVPGLRVAAAGLGLALVVLLQALQLHRSQA
jgi:hypothetical protein